ncbi:hypothetical protein [Vibrio phage vB_VhaS-a]|nr:hypothetical protein [Vibrio phage vB_VhaS-a]
MKKELINTYIVKLRRANGERFEERYKIGGDKSTKETQLQGVIDCHAVLGNTVLAIINTAV